MAECKIIAVTNQKGGVGNLILKIAALGGSHQKELLTGNIVRFNIRKHSNTQILYNVEAIEKAIREKLKLSFKYYDLNENHDRK